MLNSRAFDYRFWVTLTVCLGFGVGLDLAIPLLSSKLLYALALPFGVLFFTFMVVKPGWFLAILLFTRPLLDNVLNLTKSDVGGGQGVGLGAVLNLAVIVLSIFLSFRHATFPRRNRVVQCWMIFMFLMFLAACYSHYLFGALHLYFNYLSYFSMFIIPFLIIKTREDFLFWLKVLAWSFVLPVLAANIDLAHGGRQFEDAGKRILGTFTHPNILAFYLVLGFTFYFYFLKGKFFKFKGISIWAIRLLMLNMLILLIATKTRNAWIACLTVFFIYGLLKDKKLLTVLIMVIPLSLLIPTVKERVLTVISDKQVIDYKGLNSMEWRLRMWQSSLPLIEERPLQGWGLTSFKPMSEQFSDVGQNMGAHNAYIEILFETGIIGLISFLSLFLSCLFIFIKNMRVCAGHRSKLWAILVGYVISYMVICSADNLSYYLVFNWYVWFFLGMMLVSKEFIHD